MNRMYLFDRFYLNDKYVGYKNVRTKPGLYGDIVVSDG